MKRSTVLTLLVVVSIFFLCTCAACLGILATLVISARQSPSSAVPTPLVIMPTSPANDALSKDVTDQMDAIQRQVVQLRGLLPLDSLRREVLTPAQLRQTVENDFFKDYTSAMAQDDAQELYWLGLLPAQYDLYKLYVDLYSEQIAGYYDDQTKEMFIVQNQQFGGAERMTYSHEYTHALQDQHYDLRDGLKINQEYCDTHSEYCSAVKALVEGDASLVEQMWLFKHATPQDRTQVQQMAQSYQSPIYDAAPDFLKKDFLFPYQQGLEFAQTLYDNNGFESVDDAFSTPPVSTEQILHPQLYPNEQPLEVTLPDLKPILGTGWREIDRNALGEWYLYLLLSQGYDANARLSDQIARQAAAGWGGDQTVFYLQDQQKQAALVVSTVWDSSKDSQEFWQAINQVAQARWGTPTQQQPNRVVWENTSHGSILLVQQELRVVWVSAPDMETAGLLADQILKK